MKYRNWIIGAAAAVLSLCGTYAAAQTTATGEPKVFSGTVEIKSTQVAFLISGKTGGGVLEFQGREYEFKIGGLGVGGVGVQNIDAVGAVYNLDDISKFPGVYAQARAGATVGKGKGNLSLSNKHGVIMDLKFSGKGVALSLGADGMSVRMK
jgi:hypothetical protein